MDKRRHRRGDERDAPRKPEDRPAAVENRGDGGDSGGNTLDEHTASDAGEPRPSPPTRKTSQSGYGHRSSEHGETTPNGRRRNQVGEPPR